MLGTQYGDLGDPISLILGTRIGSLKHLYKNRGNTINFCQI